MPLFEKARIEVYLPDVPRQAYPNLLAALEQEFSYTFGGCTTVRGLEGNYLSRLGLRVRDRINLVYSDTPFPFEEHFARVERGRMPKAPVPAARQALADAGLDISQIHVIKTHNPFAVNDLWFAREMGVDAEPMNPYGSSLVYGHPQAPTGTRAIGELIEILRLRGGGFGLFTGCAAGDSAMSVLVKVDGA